MTEPTESSVWVRGFGVEDPLEAPTPAVLPKRNKGTRSPKREQTTALTGNPFNKTHGARFCVPDTVNMCCLFFRTISGGVWKAMDTDQSGRDSWRWLRAPLLENGWGPAWRPSLLGWP